MDIAGYLESVSSVYASGQATEHSYRAALEGLFRSIDPAIEVINEPKRSEGGMPDFLFQRDGIAFGWAEAKDLPKDVIKLKGYSVEQRKRYENAYPNLLYTNGVDFEFIRDKEVVHHTSIADFMGELGGLQPLPDKFGELERQLRLFVEQKPISIRSAQKLAEMMAARERGLVPLFLIDDVSSELDRERTAQLVGALSDLGAQVLATTTDPDHMGVLPPHDTLRVAVNAGSLSVFSSNEVPSEDRDSPGE